ncbi:MAG: hypothetical protein PQJ46_15275 [Spirochaetales bacterium]|nr:hypothetical protein [Spirochaetales bacterium]
MRLVKVNIFNIVSISLIIILSAFAVSCSSLPTPSSQNDSLIVIQTKRDIDSNTTPKLRLTLYFDDGSKRLLKLISDKNINYYIKSPCGTVTTQKVRVTLGSNSTFENGKNYIDYPVRFSFDVEAGTYNILPFTIKYVEEQTRSGHFTFYVTFEEIKDDEMKEISQKLQDSGIEEYWAAAKAK